MAITRVVSQNTHANGTTSCAITLPGDVTAGNLVVIGVTKYFYTSSNPPVVADLTKTAGTATIGTITLDVVREGALTNSIYISSAIYSIPVTGTGSLTLTITDTSYATLYCEEYTGIDVSATRVAGTNSNTYADNATSVGTGTVASGGGGVFVGCYSGAIFSGTLSITPDAAFSTIAEEEDANNYATGSLIDQIVSGDTTDEAAWTFTASWAAGVVLAVYKAAAGTTRNPVSMGFELR